MVQDGFLVCQGRIYRLAVLRLRLLLKKSQIAYSRHGSDTIIFY